MISDRDSRIPPSTTELPTLVSVLPDSELSTSQVGGGAPGACEHPDAVLHAVFDSSSDGLAVLNSTGEVVFANPVARDLLAAPLRQSREQDSARASTLQGRLLCGDVSDRQEVFAPSTNPQIGRWLSIRMWPLQQNAEGAGCVILVQDITAGKQISEKYAQGKEETAAASRELLLRTSRELRSHLNSMLGFAHMLAVDELALRQRSNVQQILTGGYHVLELLDDIAYLESGHLVTSPEPVRIKEAIESALLLVEPLVRDRNVSMRLEIGACRDIHVRANRELLKQALRGLFSNVIRATGMNGTVLLHCQQTSGNRVRIEICGNEDPAGNPSGRLGRPAESLPVDLTTQCVNDLSWALTQKLVVALGGELDAENTPERGDYVFIELALLEDPLQRLQGDGAAMRALAHGDRHTQQGTVLYIDDDLTNLTLMQDILAYRPGITLFTAMDALSGLHLAAARIPKWILLDLSLPDMAGELVLRRLRENPLTGLIPITVVSGHVDRETIRRLKDAGANDYLTKPLDIEKLLSLLDRTLGI